MYKGRCKIREINTYLGVFCRSFAAQILLCQNGNRNKEINGV